MQLTALRVVEIRDETIDTRSFILEMSHDDTLDYEPGQFLTLVFPGRLNQERRSYSISSSRALGEPLMFTVKRIDNGTFSRYLFDECKVGSNLMTIGASGFFTLPKPVQVDTRFYFFAAGSGITPMLPMIKQLLHFEINEVSLVYSSKTRANAIFRQALEALQQQFPDRFTIDWLFSDAQHLLKARISKMFVSDYLKERVQDPQSALLYLCGPKDYMQMITITLLAEGVPSANIRKEIFDTTKVAVKELPPDTEAHAVSIAIDGLTKTLVVQYPETILAAAKREGLVLPYSCEAGKCGTCTATCRYGRVWMSYNEVLVEAELEQGRVLTCTGYAVGGDVAIEYDR